MKYLLIFLLMVMILSFTAVAAPLKSKVYIVKTLNRAEGIKALIKESPLPDLKVKKVIIKPNFNSDDPFPATTHLDTLKITIKTLKAAGPASITILERSGMGDTEKVL